MPKKYFLAADPILFDSLDELASYIDTLQKEGKELDLSELVIGSYVGKLEQSTSFVVRSGNKVKKVKTKAPIKYSKAPVPVPVEEVEEGEEPPATLTCSFCTKPKVKTAILDKLPTHLCEDHLYVEKEMYEKT